MHNGSAVFSLLLRQPACANPIEYGIAAYSNSSKTEVYISKIGLCEWINHSKGNKVMRIHGVIFLLELQKKGRRGLLCSIPSSCECRLFLKGRHPELILLLHGYERLSLFR